MGGERLYIMAIMHVLTNPILSLQPGIYLLRGGMVSDCVREVSLAQVSLILTYVYVAPPTLVGVWSMVLGLLWRIEHYYYYSTRVVSCCTRFC